MTVSLAEALTAQPLDVAAVDRALVELAAVDNDAALAAIGEARRAVRFTGNLTIWDYQQCVLQLAKSLLGLPRDVRRVCLEYVAAISPR